jgi:hypothetical protein
MDVLSEIMLIPSFTIIYILFRSFSGDHAASTGNSTAYDFDTREGLLSRFRPFIGYKGPLGE